jgi:hypothetical protein
MRACAVLVAVSLALVVVPVFAAAVPEPQAVSPGRPEALALAAAIEPVDERRDLPTIADATMAAPLPAGVAVVGTALLALGLIRRRRV